MPRRRVFDPNFWTDSKVAKMSRDERLLFIGIFTNADDEGRIMAAPAYLKSIVFPYDDDITTKQVMDMRNHIAKINPNVILYSNDEDEYIQLLRWQDYQSPRYAKPSKLPPPPSSTKKNGKHNGKTLPSEPVFNQKDATLQPKGAVEEVVEVVTKSSSRNRDRDLVVEGVKTTSASASTSSEKKKILKSIQDLKNWKAEPDDGEWLREFLLEFPEFDLDILRACRDYYSGRGPPKGKGDWKKRLRNWMVTEREYKGQRRQSQVSRGEPKEEKGPASPKLLEGPKREKQ